MPVPDDPVDHRPGEPPGAHPGPLAPADLGHRLAAHRLSALRVATVVLGSAQGADDVVHDAVERAMRSAATFDPGRPLRPWFLHIVANTARNQRRTSGRRAALALRAGARRESPLPTPEDVVVSDDDRRRIVAALNRLDTDDRLVIALRHFEQLSEQQMAIALDCPAGTVKSRLSRAIGRLRRELQVSEADDA